MTPTLVCGRKRWQEKCHSGDWATLHRQAGVHVARTQSPHLLTSRELSLAAGRNGKSEGPEAGQGINNLQGPPLCSSVHSDPPFTWVLWNVGKAKEKGNILMSLHFPLWRKTPPARPPPRPKEFWCHLIVDSFLTCVLLAAREPGKVIFFFLDILLSQTNSCYETREHGYWIGGSQ